jgi:NitT/TauT family transport system permease protein
MLLGILIIGIIGVIFERIVFLLERRLTGWQETQGQQQQK